MFPLFNRISIKNRGREDFFTSPTDSSTSLASQTRCHPVHLCSSCCPLQKKKDNRINGINTDTGVRPLSDASSGFSDLLLGHPEPPIPLICVHPVVLFQKRKTTG